MMTGARQLAALLLAAASAACSSRGPAASPSTTPPLSPVSTATSSPTATSLPTLAPSPTPQADPQLPAGFPLDPSTRLGKVTGALGSRTISWGQGPPAESYVREDQASADPDQANDSGWDCRTHVEYEGAPAVDFYLPVGTPLRATMKGTATLYIVTVTNAFDYYGFSREPYLGNPDRSRASIAPFSPSGGKGVFVEIANDAFIVDYGHMDLDATVRAVSPGAFLADFSAGSDYRSQFAPVRDFRVFTPVARWDVKRGDIVGYSGDTGYSEAPHLHYSIKRADSSTALCPTGEYGFADGGWLLR